MLKKNDVDTKLVLDVEYADGFPSRKISKWFSTDKKFKKLNKTEEVTQQKDRKSVV